MPQLDIWTTRRSPFPFVIDNQQYLLADALNQLLSQSAGKPLDIVTAYFAISGYRLVKEGLHQVGAFRLLLGAEPHSGADVGLKPKAEALKKCIQGDLEAEPFNEATLKLVEELIAFLRADKVEVRLYDKGFLHARAYLFHQDKVGPHNRADRLRPFAAIVGSSNFTGPGLVSNRELNLVHRVILPTEDAMDREAAEPVGYLEELRERETLFDPAGIDIPDEDLSHQNERTLRGTEPPGLRHPHQLRPDLEPDPTGATQRAHRPHRQSSRRHRYLQHVP